MGSDGLSTGRDSWARIVHIVGRYGTRATIRNDFEPDHFWTKVRVEKTVASAQSTSQKGNKSLEEVGLQRANDLASAPLAEVRKRRLRLVNRVTIIVVLAILSWLAVYGLLKLIGIL
jgi:hypothetical protein